MTKTINGGWAQLGYGDGEPFTISGTGEYGTVRLVDGELVGVVEGKIREVNCTTRITVSDDEPAPDVHPAFAEGICGRVSGSPDDAECMHGECDDCQLARGEDPTNYAETRSSESYADILAKIQADLVAGGILTRPTLVPPGDCGCGPYYDCVAHDTDPKRRAAAADARRGVTAQRCECGSGVHVRGPGHADYCRLLER
jgi:hypothetical protein